MAPNVGARRCADSLANWSRSRTTSDLEILRPRDSASMSATSGSGKRTVRVFMASVYYIRVSDTIQFSSERPYKVLRRVQTDA